MNEAAYLTGYLHGVGCSVLRLSTLHKEAAGYGDLEALAGSASSPAKSMQQTSDRVMGALQKRTKDNTNPAVSAFNTQRLLGNVQSSPPKATPGPSPAAYAAMRESYTKGYSPSEQKMKLFNQAQETAASYYGKGSPQYQQFMARANKAFKGPGAAQQFRRQIALLRPGSGEDTDVNKLYAQFKQQAGQLYGKSSPRFQRAMEQAKAALKKGDLRSARQFRKQLDILNRRRGAVAGKRNTTTPQA